MKWSPEGGPKMEQEMNPKWSQNGDKIGTIQNLITVRSKPNHGRQKPNHGLAKPNHGVAKTKSRHQNLIMIILF